jgi:hypothetical protein
MVPVNGSMGLAILTKLHEGIRLILHPIHLQVLPGTNTHLKKYDRQFTHIVRRKHLPTRR